MHGPLIQKSGGIFKEPLITDISFYILNTACLGKTSLNQLGRERNSMIAFRNPFPGSFKPEKDLVFQTHSFQIVPDSSSGF